MNDRPQPPQLTESMRAAARSMPGQWVYAIDPFFDPDGEVPPYGVIGAWPVDQRGEISDEFTPNPNYRPSPITLGFGEPSDPLDAAIQLASTGYSDGKDVVPLFLEAEILTGAGEGGAIPVFYDDAGKVVMAYSARSHLPDDLPDQIDGWQALSGRTLITLTPPDVDVAINADSPARIRIPRSSFDA